jgi:PAS domain S-box-containing protein
VQKVANVGSWEYELSTGNVTWHTQSCRIFEIDPAQLQSMAQELFEFVHPDDREKVKTAMEASLHEHSPSAVEYRIVMPDGRVKYIEEHFQALRDEQGAPTALTGASLDITARVRAEEEIHAAHQQLTYHVENSPLAVLEWDSEFRLHRWSHQAESLFGWRAEEVVGKHPGDWTFVYRDDEAAVEKLISRLQQGNEPRSLSTNRNYTKDGQVVQCEWYNSVLLGRDGSLVSVLSLVHDITERTKAEQALLRSQRVRAS